MFQDKYKPSEKNQFHSIHAGLLVSSFKLLTGEDMIGSDPAVESISRDIFFAPFAVLSHGTEADPIFNYANQCALDLFEMSWEEFIKLPSRLSAEIKSQVARDRVMQQVSANGYVDDYVSVRISSKGKRFNVSNTTIWNLIDNDHYYGQAALIRQWDYLD